jgi:hypothetical protein
MCVSTHNSYNEKNDYARQNKLHRFCFMLNVLFLKILPTNMELKIQCICSEKIIYLQVLRQ